MKELDFDELDRAVNSLMPTVTGTDVPVDDGVKTLTIPSSSTSADMSVPITVARPPVVSRSTTPVTPLAARRGGRFMDVVHPSSDMKKPESVRPSISRQGVTIAPSASPTASETPSNTPVDQPQTTVEPEHMASEWPDPLEMADFKDEPEVTPESTAEQPAPDNSPKDEEEIAPLTSPFLPGAKVEKRPLGGAAAAEDVAEPASNPGFGKQDLSIDDPTDQLPATPEDVAIQMPEELQGDLVAIESGAASKELPVGTSPVDTVPEVVEKPTPAPESKEKEKEPAPSGPVSIPQQYREEPTTGEAENGSIYDTDTYHQPLAHPGKKKSGWLWVVWIVLILLVGAGAGAALYFLGII